MTKQQGYKSMPSAIPDNKTIHEYYCWVLYHDSTKGTKGVSIARFLSAWLLALMFV